MNKQVCQLCGQTKLKELLTSRALDRLDGPTYRYLQCDHCGLVKLEGHLETRAEDYEKSGYYSARAPLVAPVLSKTLQMMECARLRTIERLAPDLTVGRVLDIGSGKARFLRCALAQGWQATGLEPVRLADKTVEEGQGLTIVRDYLRADLWESEQFDLITLWHVLEHLPDPLWAMQVAHNWLKKDGAIALAMPNLDSWQAKIGKGVWFHLDPPRHLHHFTPPTLKKLLEAAGFVDVKFVFPLFGLNVLGMPMTVLNRLGFSPNLLYNFLKRNRAGLPSSKGRLTIEAILSTLALALLSAPLFFLTLAESLLGHGGTMIVLARKH